MYLKDPLNTLPGINRLAGTLAKLDIQNVGGLLTHFPRYVQDNSEIIRIAELKEGVSSVVEGEIIKFRSIRLKNRGRTMQTAVLIDDSGELQLIWFNQPFLERTIKAAQRYRLKGKLKQNSGRFHFMPERLEIVAEGKESLQLGRISPVYSLTEGIKPGWLRARIFDLLNRLNEIEELKTIDKYCKNELGFDLYDALKQIHFPDSEEQYLLATKNLSLLELTSLQLKIKLAAQQQPTQKTPQITGFSTVLNQFLKSLPFSPTPDQLTVIEEILADFNQGNPNQRLIQGDVGSGKTLVAMAASIAMATSGLQTVVLAPTTVLAVQHFHNFNKFLKDLNIEVALVTSSTNQTTAAQVLIGTSAVLARKQSLIKKLGLVIVDEQHRFGVRQREELLEFLNQGENIKEIPHLINLTATPIPRTLAQALFANLKVSTISTKPAGRLPIKTFVVPENKREDSYDWISNQLREEKAQIYWICPLVEESDNNQVKAAETTFAHLQALYPEIRIGLLHGRMKNDEKEQALQKFAEGETQVLVSTSVVEVGVDVPNASVIVIEGAERFGLAQLHQLRGRVGRGEKQSWCFLFASDGYSEQAAERLEYFAKHLDGLEIAMYDLERRGPGEVYGTKQAGIPNLKIAKLDNLELIKKSSEVAEKVIQDQQLSNLLISFL